MVFWGEVITRRYHYNYVIIGTIASQITSLTIVYSTIYSGGDQRKHQSSASLAFVQRIHREPVNSPHKWSVTRKMFPFDDVIMIPRLLKLGYGEAITTHVIIHPYFQLRTGLSWRAWVYNYAHIKLWGIITYPDDCRFVRLTATHF